MLRRFLFFTGFPKSSEKMNTPKVGFRLLKSDKLKKLIIYGKNKDNAVCTVQNGMIKFPLRCMRTQHRSGYV